MAIADSTSGRIPQSGGNRRNDALDKCRELMERFENRLTLANARLADRYVKSELQIGIRFLIRSTDIEFEAWFKRESLVSGHEELIHSLKRRLNEISGAELVKKCGRETAGEHLAQMDSGRARTDCQQDPVLLDVVKSVEHPQEVIPSLVWFERVDCVDSFLRRSLYFSALLGFVFRGIVLDGEVDPIGIWRIVPRIATDQLKSEMIERTHQILNDVPSDEWQALGRGFNASDVIDWLSGVRVYLTSDSIRIGVEESADLFLQVRDVFFGPFDF